MTSQYHVFPEAKVFDILQLLSIERMEKVLKIPGTQSEELAAARVNWKESIHYQCVVCDEVDGFRTEVLPWRGDLIENYFSIRSYRYLLNKVVRKTSTDITTFSFDGSGRQLYQIWRGSHW